MSQPFQSIEIFREQFNHGLYHLLDSQSLGTFILCLANASQDKNLFAQLKSKLCEQYLYFTEQYKADLQHGNQLDLVEEDLLVFLKLHIIGFDNIRLTQQRVESHWQCQFNHIRSFRPRRISSFHDDTEITAPYDRYTFNFNKQFMQKECFWQGEFSGKQLDLFYNKYPFANLHGICVPEKNLCLPQMLTEEMHHYIYQVCQQLEMTLPGVGFGYNSYGAYASVNHLHFQMFIDSQGLPVTSLKWQHNGGNDVYPLKVIRCNDSQQAWNHINELHQQKQPYNLLYYKADVYIMVRKVQGSVDVPIWSSGFTWYELSGAMLMFNQDDYLHIHEDDIYKFLSENML